MESDTMMQSQRLSLNGLPPGTRYIGNLSIAPGQTGEIPLTARYLSLHPLGFDDLVLSADLDGDGVPEPLTSVGLRSYIPRCVADVSPPPVGSGTVDIDDLLLVINSWGACPQPCPPPNPNTCPADIDGNCVVNIDDLLSVINHWGACPF